MCSSLKGDLFSACRQPLLSLCLWVSITLKVDFYLINFTNIFSGNIWAFQFPFLIHTNSLSVENIMDDIKDTILLLWLFRKRRKSRSLMQKKKERKFWVRPIFRERKLKGEFHALIQDLNLLDTEYFFEQFRMTPTMLEELLSWVAPKIEKSTVGHESNGPEQRLCFTLCYLVTGDAHVAIAGSYRIGPASIGSIIKETTGSIITII